MQVQASRRAHSGVRVLLLPILSAGTVVFRLRQRSVASEVMA